MNSALTLLDSPPNASSFLSTQRIVNVWWKQISKYFQKPNRDGHTLLYHNLGLGQNGYNHKTFPTPYYNDFFESITKFAGSCLIQVCKTATSYHQHFFTMYAGVKTSRCTESEYQVRNTK